jgi:hypothetical protein
MFAIRPGRATCAGLVGILMVLPNSIWKAPEADQTAVRPPTERIVNARPRARIKVRADERRQTHQHRNTASDQ